VENDENVFCRLQQTVLSVVVTVVQEVFDRFLSFFTTTRWRSDFLDGMKVFVETAVASKDLRELVVDVVSSKADSIRGSLEELFRVFSMNTAGPFPLPHFSVAFLTLLLSSKRD
jgi:hypothetical protein